MTLITKTVREWAAVLDQVRPDWHERIDLDKLDLNLYSKCVLGQVFDSYGNGRLALADALYVDPFDLNMQVFDREPFRDEWEHEIRARQLNNGERSYTVAELRELAAAGKLEELLVPPNPVDQLIAEYADDIVNIVEHGTYVENTWRGVLAKFLMDVDKTRAGEFS